MHKKICIVKLFDINMYFEYKLYMKKNNNYSDEIQIEIDDVYGCPGHCPGCILSTVERKTVNPDMDINLLEKTISKLINYVNSLNNIDKLNLTYGIADHFLMDNEYLKRTYNLGADLIEKTNKNNGTNGIFYTASMIGKHENILNKVKYLYEISKERKVPFYIIAVLDPKNLYRKNFADIYKNNIIKTNELIGKVDLSINLSEEAIDKVSPQEIYEFTVNNHFDELTINWTPTNDNINYVYLNQTKLLNWLIELDEIIEKNNDLIGTSYRTVIKRTINSIMCKSDNLLMNDFNQEVKMKMNELVTKSIQVNEKGDIFPKYEAIGDIAHSPRFNINPWGNINQDIEISEIIKNNIINTEKFVLKQFIKEPCLNCEYNKFCSNSGFHIYNYILNNNKSIKNIVSDNIKNNSCYHIAKGLFDYYYKKELILNKSNI